MRRTKRSIHCSLVTLNSIASGLRGRGLDRGARPLPGAADEQLVRAELRLVGHLAAAVDPVAEIDVGQAQEPRLLDLPEDVVGAVAGARLGLEEGVDGGEA